MSKHDMKIRQALTQAIRQSDLSLREKVALRLALVFRGNEIEQVVSDALMEADLVLPSSGDITSPDWESIITFFIEVILPLILKLIG